MSEVKVNKVSSRTGNAVTLGNSGDTLTVPSGVTITSAGTVSGGFKDIQWQTVVTADGSTNTTAESGKGYPIDTTSAAHTINLPASPSAGDTVAIIDYAGNFGTNNVTVGRNSSNIQGAAADGTISTNRRAITFVYIDSTQGWIPVNDNTTESYGATFVAATGGTVTTSSNDKIHTFTSTGCFVVSNAGNSAGSNTVEYLVVAGGGSGGHNHAAGGGGGGYRTNHSNCTPSPATGGFAITAQTYPITVGAGASGPGDTNNPGNKGSNSVFSTITSAGGGGGAGGGSSCNATNGPGGSGGGGGRCYTSGGSGNTPPVSPAQGNDGGNGVNPPGHSGGGGGAGEAGKPGTTPDGSGGFGRGADGAASTITGSSVRRAGGGGAGNYCGPSTNESTGADGGGNGGRCAVGTAGSANTGGGGGGGGWTSKGGGLGGSGIVVIRYKYQ